MKHLDAAIDIYMDQFGTPQNLFDIGAFNGDTANYVSTRLDIDQTRVYCVDASPQAIAQIQVHYPVFNKHMLAISNYEGVASFNITPVGARDKIGMNSLRTRPDYDYPETIEVETTTLADYMINKTHETSIDFLKIDVEGCAYEVLEGAGFSVLRSTRLIVVEAEHRPYWDGQHLYDEIAHLLNRAGFIQMEFIRNEDQSDSVWVNTI